MGLLAKMVRMAHPTQECLCIHQRDCVGEPPMLQFAPTYNAKNCFIARSACCK
ncbi:hypothetical protein QEO96_06465 [Kingella negevensis]|uniref:hypothetical protein n=1 Tax=Kingella negevensis TaxID=1522312 RepID=UPI002550FFEF|nr:hypothetical protein [Kingella negevensis]MDK4693202.1 hypothetical protein [Kingella negevensis]